MREIEASGFVHVGLSLDVYTFTSELKENNFMEKSKRFYPMITKLLKLTQNCMENQFYDF